MDQQLEKNKLFVGNLDRHLRWQELKDFFGQWGEVTYAKIMLDRETNRSRGFGFVVFANDEDAAKAKEEAEGQELEGRELHVDFAKARPDDGWAAAQPAGDDDDDDDEGEENTEETTEESDEGKEEDMAEEEDADDEQDEEESKDE